MTNPLSAFGFPPEAMKRTFLPIIQYNAKEGVFYRIDRTQGRDGAFISKQVDITDGFMMLCDFTSIEVGWIDFAPGQPPSFAMVPYGNEWPDKPTDKHKGGIRFICMLPERLANGEPVREIAATSNAFMWAMAPIFKQFWEERDTRGLNMLPVVALDGEPHLVRSGGARAPENYHPTFRIDDWVDRSLLDERNPLPRIAERAPRPGVNSPFTQQRQPPQQIGSNAAPGGGGGFGSGPPSTGAQRASAPTSRGSGRDFG